VSHTAFCIIVPGLHAEEVITHIVYKAGCIGKCLADHGQAEVAEHAGYVVLKPEHALQPGEHDFRIIQHGKEQVACLEVRCNHLDVLEAVGVKTRTYMQHVIRIPVAVHVLLCAADRQARGREEDRQVDRRGTVHTDIQVVTEFAD